MNGILKLIHGSTEDEGHERCSSEAATVATELGVGSSGFVWIGDGGLVEVDGLWLRTNGRVLLLEGSVVGGLGRSGLVR